MSTSDQLSTISTYAGLLPVVAGIIVFKKAGAQSRLLLFFLSCAFLTDFFSGQFHESGEDRDERFIYSLYALLEAVFFSLFIYQTKHSKSIRLIAIAGVLIWPLIWIYINIDFKTLQWIDDPASIDMFVSAYEIVIASLSAACILRLTTRGESLASISLFWSLVGIYFY